MTSTMPVTYDKDNSGLVAMVMGLMGRKDHDGDRTGLSLVVIVVLIVFFIAIIFLAVMMRDDRRRGGGEIGETLAAAIAAKSIGHDDGYGKNAVVEKLEHSEDRARATQTQQEIGALGKSFMELGFGLSGQIKDVEIKGLEKYAVLENQVGQMQFGINQLLTAQNNTAIADLVFKQMLGYPRCG